MEPLAEILKLLSEQNVVLSRARHAYLMKEAERKHFESTLIIKAQGSALKISHAERVTIAQSSDEWLKFHKALAKLESIYQFELFKYQIIDKNYLAAYLCQKQDGEEMKKQG